MNQVDVAVVVAVIDCMYKVGAINAFWMVQRMRRRCDQDSKSQAMLTDETDDDD